MATHAVVPRRGAAPAPDAAPDDARRALAYALGLVNEGRDAEAARWFSRIADALTVAARDNADVAYLVAMLAAEISPDGP